MTLPFETLTPRALKNSLQRAQPDGDRVYPLTSSITEQNAGIVYVLVEPDYTDPYTCLITKGSRDKIKKKLITGVDMSSLVSVEQPRRETVSVVVKPKIQAFGGAEVVRETVQIGDVTSRIYGRVIYSYGEPPNRTVSTTRVVMADSAFTRLSGSQRDLRGNMSDIFLALSRRAETIAIRRSHCVEITLTVPLAAAWGLSLRDRVTLSDRRLSGGEATGKISGIEMSMGPSETATITLSCPVSEAGSTINAPQIQGSISMHDGTGTPGTTTAMRAMRGSSDVDLVKSVTVSSQAAEQIDQISQSVEGPGNPEPTPNPDAINSITKTSVSVELAGLDYVQESDMKKFEVLISKRDLELPKGVNVS